MNLKWSVLLIFFLSACGVQIKNKNALDATGEFTGSNFNFTGTGIGNHVNSTNLLWAWNFKLNNAATNLNCDTNADIASSGATYTSSTSSTCTPSYALSGTSQSPVLTPTVSGPVTVTYTVTLTDPTGAVAPQSVSGTVTSTGGGIATCTAEWGHPTALWGSCNWQP